MVGKLMKHELKSLFRTLIALGIVVLLIACIGRLLIATDPSGYIGIIFTIVAIYLSIVVLFAAYITSIAQFSRSLFTGEGYMTFSLPVTPTQLIVSKLLSAIIATLFGVAVCAASCAIALTAVPAAEWDHVVEMLGEVWNAISVYYSSDPMLIVEAVIIMLCSVPMSLLFLYLVASVGQLFTAHRKAVTFGIAVGALVVLSLLDGYLFQFILEKSAEVSMHLANWIQIVVYLGIDFGCFFAVRYILKNKLNLIV